MSAGSALELADIQYRIGAARILTDVSLRIAPGEIVCLIGPNGAGKTTLMNVITGTVQPQSGSITWQGRDVTRHGPHHRSRLGLGRTFQTSYLFDQLTLLENVALGAGGPHASGFRGLLGIGANARHLREQAGESLEMVGLGAKAHQRVSSLSHAERRKVEIAISLVSGADMVLLDEPMAGVSAEDVPDLVELIQRLATPTTSVMLVEHHMDVVLQLAHRLVVLHHGEVLAEGHPDDVMNNREVQTAYMGEEL
ncbi:ABC transporter ATP-binding protein [Streptomyces brasiliensis]|uniref:ABC transporter ATP-binding protein n=1 Tax=Streptomyces brasiliensis TaxID=1954 RepID=A0A917P7H8_9ACTN|nr:ABC transporter ATP-binding protein [Streptomyces brasiliensis]GGJ65480.1 ABC transporter ATP-binding protein [Streptomyces brasiliensis]